jgi:hypothetical protein
LERFVGGHMSASSLARLCTNLKGDKGKEQKGKLV